MRLLPFSAASGGGLVLVGLLALVGWVRHEPALVRLLPGSEAMSFSSAVAAILAGIAIVVTGAARGRVGDRVARRHLRRLSLALGAAVGTVGLAALAEWVGDLPLGLALDPLATSRWLHEPYPFPGRMRPMSAIGFGAIGCSLMLLQIRDPSRRQLRLNALLSLLVLGVGMLGLAGSLSSVSALFVAPVMTTGMVLIVSGLGLLSLLRSSPGYGQVWGGNDSERITFMAAAVVVFTGMAGIVGGFGVLYPQVVKELEENLALSLHNRTDALVGAIHEAWQASRDFADRPHQVETMAKIAGGRDAARARALLAKVAAEAPLFGFSAVRFLDPAGREVARGGAFIPDPEMAAALHLPSTAQLLWSEGYLLRTTVEMRRAGALVGFMEAERRLAVGPLFEAEDEHLGATIDFPVCARAAEGVDCFPFRSSGGKVLRALPLQFNGHPIPMAYASEGRRGIVRTTDYRGVQVIGAYGPVGELGLFAALKIDAAEFYQPVAQRAWPLLLCLLLVAAGAILLLHFEVVPLVHKMRREIEERRRAEERLQQSEANLAEITATLGEGVYVLDVNGAVTFANPEAERLLGWSAAELLGRDAHQLFHSRRPDGSVLAEAQCPVHQSFLLGVTYRSSDEWFVRKDGSFVPVSIVSSPIWREGKVEGSVASFMDVTEQKRIAQELARHRDHLEQLVEERTGELRKLNRELEAFSYSVSHDLRAPLRAINGYSGALREDYGSMVPAEAHAYLDRMQAATLRMGELVDGLLNLSQVIRSEPDLCEVDLSHLAAVIAGSLREAEPRRNVAFCIAPEITAVGDPALLRVLLENLLLNAWKFTAVRVEGRIDFGREVVNGERVCFVRDNGVGFDMQYAHRLFQPFERLHQHGEFAGNGIGLATVRRIVERHGGRVWASSGLGEGTTIYFVLGRQQ